MFALFVFVFLFLFYLFIIVFFVIFALFCFVLFFFVAFFSLMIFKIKKLNVNLKSFYFGLYWYLIIIIFGLFTHFYGKPF